MEAEKKVESAQAKYDATKALYDVEKAAKEQREFDEGVKQATQEFHDRQAETTRLLGEYEQPLEDAKTAL